MENFQHLWRLTNTWVQKSKRWKNYFALKEKKKNQNLEMQMKAALRGKLLALNVYIRRGETSKLREMSWWSKRWKHSGVIS